MWYDCLVFFFLSLSLTHTHTHTQERYLSRHPCNVVAVHCKAGKGRTGVMVSCYLMHASKQARTGGAIAQGHVSTPGEALRHFARVRTGDGKGVTIPSQRRYVEYYARILDAGPVSQSPRKILKMIARPVPNVRCMHARTLRARTHPTHSARTPHSLT
jgi:phosphatidylinositol-3,4,5-trisphosphate 3-phosphatase/dual-specificity protein phosphatase PTEN